MTVKTTTKLKIKTLKLITSSKLEPPVSGFVKLWPLIKTCLILLIASVILFAFEIPNSYALVEKNPIFKDIKLSANNQEWNDFKKSENQFWKQTVKNSELQTCDQSCQESSVSNVLGEQQIQEEQASQNIELQTDQIPIDENIVSEIKTEALVIPVVEIQKLQRPLKVLIVGDSLMQEKLGIHLETQLKKLNFTVFRFAKYSTGLTNRSYFDWPGTVAKLVREQKPDIVVSIFGSNDGQKIASGRKLINYGAPGWNEAYAKNVNAFISEASNGVKKVYFFGLPVASKSDFTEKFKRFNAIYKQEISNYKNVVFIDTWDRFSPNGNYNATLKDVSGKSGRVKFEDGIHFTDFGSKIMLEILIENMSKDIQF